MEDFNNLDIVLDHVAIVSKDLNSLEKIYTDLGLKSNFREKVVSEGVQTSFLQADQNASLELLEPLAVDGVIAKFLQKKGPGIHHLAFKVTNLQDKMKHLKSLGHNFIYETPRKGAHQKMVNFIHPKTTSGVLIELVEKITS